MLGLMMDVPLLLSRLIDYAAECHGTTEVVGRALDGSIERTNYRQLRGRAARLANALVAGNYGVNSRFATIAWNTINHVESFYAALGIGASLHTINPRLSAEHIAYMVNQVDDELIFIDADTLPLAERVAPLVDKVKCWVYLDSGEPLPVSSLQNLVHKSTWVAEHSDQIEWPQFDEHQAATICYTSGTTGMPKGVAYSHRSIVLSAINMTMADMYGGYNSGDLETVMPIAPIFHANGWQMPFTAPMNGHKLVLPGRNFEPDKLLELMLAENVTLAGAVPTVWMDIFALLDSKGGSLPNLKTALCAGTRMSRPLFDRFKREGINVCQSWGMTEAPGTTKGTLPPGAGSLPEEEREALEFRYQGRLGFLVQQRIVDDEGQPLPHDGKASGVMQIRGNTVVGRYIGQEQAQQVDWLDTGDIVRIEPNGLVEIVDRSKDVIKSGGEWISSLLLEEAATSHPAVAQAAVISMPHPRWQERPLMLCTLVTGATCTEQMLLQHMQDKVAKWWLPDEIRFVDSMPLTPTGKISKVKLREIHLGRSSQMVAE
ncbi:MAG: long-chain fatty acid--CoA ligase [Gammaproteobacteria bacterium]|nr:long-chain fatty acid--CoA ligase [Gammaproteobacteria bacterium]